jgi:alkylation response protein AidB-like acyl-CoA dehydrogenase
MDKDDIFLLVQTADRWFSDHSPLTERAAHSSNGHHAPPQAWHAMAEMGWLSLTLDEAHGGFGAGRAQAFELLRRAGRDARPEPLDVHLVLAPVVARAAPELADRLASGDIRLAIADVPDREASPQWAEGRLSGDLSIVYGAEHATHLLVPLTAATDGPLLLVELRSSEVTLRGVRLIDGRAGLQVSLKGARARVIGLANLAVDLAAAAVVADSCGSFEAAFELTLDYLKQRVQFGRPLSTQQAVQHRMADIFCDLQQHIALTTRLATEMDTSPEGPWTTLPAAKAFIGRRALRAIGGLIQMSGGIAVTEEYQLSHFYRRVHVAAQLFGSAQAQLARIDASKSLINQN